MSTDGINGSDYSAETLLDSKIFEDFFFAVSLFVVLRFSFLVKT